MDPKSITVHHMTYQITRPNTTLFFYVGEGGFVKVPVYWTQICDLADLQQRIYAVVNNITQQMFRNTWVEVEYRLDISRATNGSHVEVNGTLR